jgi:hypothetical protein
MSLVSASYLKYGYGDTKKGASTTEFLTAEFQQEIKN